MKWKRKLLPKTNNAKQSENRIPTFTSKEQAQCVTPSYADNDDEYTHFCPLVESSEAIGEVVSDRLCCEALLSNSHFDSPFQGCESEDQSSGSSSLKCKSTIDTSCDAFSRYSQLCARNVSTRSSLNSPEAGNCSNFRVVQQFLDLKGVLKRTQRNVNIDVSRPKYRQSLQEYNTLAGYECTREMGKAVLSYRDLWSILCNCCFNYRKRTQRNEASEEEDLSSTTYVCGGVEILHEHIETFCDPPEYIKDLLQNKHFMENIMAYNQMFAMTSFGAKVDDSINRGRGPYVFKVFGQVYHWIGSLCPPAREPPRFLQLYIYDTKHEVENRMWHFGGIDDSNLDSKIVEGLIHFLDVHDELVQLFRTARDKCREIFKIRLYNAEGACGYELPTSNTLGAIVFDSGVTGNTNFDVIIQEKDGPAKRINKHHKSYMSLQFLLLFHLTGQQVLTRAVMLKPAMTAYVEREKGRTSTRCIACAFTMHISSSSRQEERDGFGVGKEEYNAIVFSTRGPWYMYAHYLDALAICRKLVLLYSLNFKSNIAHTLLWVDSESKIQGHEDVDRLISAKLPDLQTDPQGYKVVLEMMIHEPCGDVNMSATCMQRDKCTKNFPKKFTPKTVFDDEGRVHYQRKDTGVSTVKHQGSDMIFARVSRPLSESSNAVGPSRPPIDEIQNYLEGRFVCPYEALWRILKFDIHCREPVVQILSVHLEGIAKSHFS
ncbi:hypothetical protein Tco_0005996 [Tanacetum coccineum]